MGKARAVSVPAEGGCAARGLGAAGHEQVVGRDGQGRPVGEGHGWHIGGSGPRWSLPRWSGSQPRPALAPHTSSRATLPSKWPACVSHSASPSPGPQARGFPCCRESRGSFQSCSELDAFPRASWSVSRRPGLGGEPHGGRPHLHTVLDFRPVCKGSSGCPRPGHLSPHVGAAPLSPLLP